MQTDQSFQDLQTSLLETFESHGFAKLLADQKQAETVLDRLPDNTEIVAVFPGYKSRLRNGRITTYDYRVDIRKNGVCVPLSHPELVMHFAMKVDSCVPSQKMHQMLGGLAVNGVIPNNATYPDVDLDCVGCGSRWQVNEAVAGYEAANKRFVDRELPDLTITELFHCARWIVLQEDINYPISRGYLGRKMPFARYLEAIWHEALGKPLREVIHRALLHSRPPPWPELDYDFINTIR